LLIKDVMPPVIRVKPDVANRLFVCVHYSTIANGTNQAGTDERTV
jgi:hypothetical protein